MMERLLMRQLFMLEMMQLLSFVGTVNRLSPHTEDDIVYCSAA